LALVAALPLGAQADQPTAGKQSEQTCVGTLSAVNAQGNTVTLRTWWRSRTFNLGDRCVILAIDKGGVALSDLRPGVEVRIRYQKVDGVLVADRIAERPLHYAGTVDAVDAKARTVTMAEEPLAKPFRRPRVFRIADDCKVILPDGKHATLASLQAGDRITILYESPGWTPVAYRIRQRSLTFVGMVDEVDLSGRTVEAKDMLAGKKFELSDQCRILGPDGRAGHLKDVALGRRYEFTYENVEGVNVLTRIAPAQPAMSTETAATR